MLRDGIPNTIVVALGVCLVCSLLVSSAAIGLRGLQATNRALDIKANIVTVAGFEREQIRESGGVENVFRERFTQTIIRLETGEEAIDEVRELFGFATREEALLKYDQFKASKAPPREEKSTVLNRREDLAGLSKLEKYSFVYMLTDEQGEITKYILPIRGRGLWSTLKGFISLEPDLQTVAGITFYEHAETPGLGGEVDNPGWKNQWAGKKVYADGGTITSEGQVPEVKLNVVKGQASDEFGVDGLAGATITARGVSDMIEFWLGNEGFGPYIAKMKQQQAQSESAKATVTEEGAADG